MNGQCDIWMSQCDIWMVSCYTRMRHLVRTWLGYLPWLFYVTHPCVRMSHVWHMNGFLLRTNETCRIYIIETSRNYSKHDVKRWMRLHTNETCRIYIIETSRIDEMSHIERWGAGVETQKNVRGEIGGWGRVPFNEPYAPSLSTIYDGA